MHISTLVLLFSFWKICFLSETNWLIYSSNINAFKIKEGISHCLLGNSNDVKHKARDSHACYVSGSSGAIGILHRASKRERTTNIRDAESTTRKENVRYGHCQDCIQGNLIRM